MSKFVTEEDEIEIKLPKKGATKALEPTGTVVHDDAGREFVLLGRDPGEVAREAWAEIEEEATERDRRLAELAEEAEGEEGPPFKHLPGKHPQQRHAGTRAGFREATDEDRERIKGLGSKVFVRAEVNEDEGAPLQAIAYRADGTDKYFYSATHMERQAAAKFERGRAFDAELPALSQRIEADMGGEGRKADAAAVLYTQKTMAFRVGGEGKSVVGGEFVEGRRVGGETVETFGAASLRKQHVRVEGDTVHFDFPGKSGAQQVHSSSDPKLVALVKGRLGRNQDQLFSVNDSGVRAYLKEIDGPFKTHDFRTWGANATAREAIGRMPAPKTPREFARARNAVADRVAQKLGDKRGTVLKNYIDPKVFQEWQKAAGVDD